MTKRGNRANAWNFVFELVGIILLIKSEIFWFYLVCLLFICIFVFDIQIINSNKMVVEMTKEQNISDLQHVSQYLSTIEDFRIAPCLFSYDG